MTIPVLLIMLAAFLAAAFWSTQRQSTRLHQLSWDDLIGRLEPLPASGISKVALDYLQPSKGQIAIETDELWYLIGEAEGLRRMVTNADVLLALAGFAQQWNFEEGVIVAERMRRDAKALKRAARRVSLGLIFGYDKAHGPFSLQEAASSYYLMRRRLLALYETSHVGRYPALAAAV